MTRKHQLRSARGAKPSTTEYQSDGTRSMRWAAGTAAAAALYFSPGIGTSLDADIVYNGSEFTVTQSTLDTEWDVDGDGANDFFFRKDSYGSTFLYISIDMNSNGGRNGRGFINFGAGSSSDDVRNLPAGFRIGGSLANGYSWGASAQSDRNAVFGSVGSGYYQYPGMDMQGFNLDESGYVGFRFESSGSLHYGWARMTLNSSPDYGSVTIHEWAYNDTSGGSILAGQSIPEPGHLGGLAALACGAAGLRRTRRKRNLD